jgi:hypothetical protein
MKNITKIIYYNIKKLFFLVCKNFRYYIKNVKNFIQNKAKLKKKLF